MTVNLDRCAACNRTLASFYGRGPDDGARWNDDLGGYVCRNCSEARLHAVRAEYAEKHKTVRDQLYGPDGGEQT